MYTALHCCDSTLCQGGQDPGFLCLVVTLRSTVTHMSSESSQPDLSRPCLRLVLPLFSLSSRLPFALVFTELHPVSFWLLVQFVEVISNSNCIPQGFSLHFKFSPVYELNEYAAVASQSLMTILTRSGCRTESCATPLLCVHLSKEMYVQVFLTKFSFENICLPLQNLESPR